MSRNAKYDPTLRLTGPPGLTSGWGVLQPDAGLGYTPLTFDDQSGGYRERPAVVMSVAALIVAGDCGDGYAWAVLVHGLQTRRRFANAPLVSLALVALPFDGPHRP